MKFLQVLCYKYINIYVLFKVNIKVKSPQNRPRRPRVGVEVYLYSFFNLGARWVCVVSTTPRTLYPLERPGSHPLLSGIFKSPTLCYNKVADAQISEVGEISPSLPKSSNYSNAYYHVI